MESEPTRLVCKVCVRQYAKYTCPKCNITYCSLSCYKQHSERCTEAFAREQAVTQLKLTTVEDEQKRKMVEILKRLREQEDDEESEDGSEDEPGASVLSAETLERLAEKVREQEGEHWQAAATEGRFTWCICLTHAWPSSTRARLASDVTRRAALPSAHQRRSWREVRSCVRTTCRRRSAPRFGGPCNTARRRAVCWSLGSRGGREQRQQS